MDEQQYDCPACEYDHDEVVWMIFSHDVEMDDGRDGEEWFCPRCDFRMTVDKVENDE